MECSLVAYRFEPAVSSFDTFLALLEPMVVVMGLWEKQEIHHVECFDNKPHQIEVSTNPHFRMQKHETLVVLYGVVIMNHQIGFVTYQTGTRYAQPCPAGKARAKKNKNPMPRQAHGEVRQANLGVGIIRASYQMGSDPRGVRGG